jgi:uncharacterized Zn-finger protein
MDSVDNKRKAEEASSSEDVAGKKRKIATGDSKSEPAVFKCSVCNYSSKQRCHVVNHERIHTGEKPHACSFPGCNYRASRKHHIVYHERVHSDAKPYSCDYKKENGEKCTYATKFKSDLNLHQRIHRGEKNFVCTFPACSYKASQRGNLIRCVFLFFYSIFPINFLFLSRFELFKYFLI